MTDSLKLIALENASRVEMYYWAILLLFGSLMAPIGFFIRHTERKQHR